jgi:hypothetical protein
MVIPWTLMQWNTAGTQALCKIPGDVECMLKQVSVFLLHSGYILQKLRERERERVIHMQYTKENCAENSTFYWAID